MKFKKLVSIFLSCALMAGMMAGCAGDTGTSSAPATDGQVSEAATGDDTTAGGNHKIYLITMDQMDQHWVNVDAGCKKAVEELGNVDYTWLAPRRRVGGGLYRLSYRAAVCVTSKGRLYAYD